MVECIVCKRPDANIKIDGNAMVTVCGEKDCRDSKGRTLGEWLIDDNSINGNYHLLKGLPGFNIHMDGRTIELPNDKRVIRGLHNKIQELKKEQN